MKKKRYKLDATTGQIMIDEKGNPIIEVYTEEDGKITVIEEYGVDAIHLLDKIPELNREAQTHRQAKEKLEEQLKSFADIDPVKAKEALEKVSDLEKNGKLDTEQIDKIKADLLTVEKEKFDKMKKELTDIITNKEQTIASQQEDIYDSLVSTKFDNSSYFTGKDPKTLLPAAVALSYWKSNFKVEKDEKTKKNKIIPYDQNGDIIYSRQRPGEIANFDEAMGIIIDKCDDAFKSRILPASGGSGAPGGGRPGTGYGEIIKKLPAEQRLTELRKAMSGS